MIALNAVGQSYRHFVIVKYLPIRELQSTLIELVHEPTGARIVHIANDDPENLFCISLQTLPETSNGIAHILEHIVLCGSKRFPVRDPFFSMARRSLNTYMNALTGQDFTCYPASSQIEIDFYHLLDVYLDAVFHPLLTEMSFYQEGHRLSLPEGDIQQPLQYKGVVYNEMKGSMASSSRRMLSILFRNLTPDLPYAHNSGGDPKEIPQLTLEELREFHHSFYHPSRAIFFFYGNLPLSHHLDYIESRVLQGREKLSALPPLPQQKRFLDPLYVEAKYPIAAHESREKKIEVALGWLTTSLAHELDLLALALLDLLWMDTDGSPLKMALLKSNLCLQADSFLDTEMSEVPWILICKGCEEGSAEAIEALLFQEWKRLKRRGFSQEEVEAALHQLEFERTEINPDGGPFGLTLFFRTVLAKQHGCDLERGLSIHRLFEELRVHIQQPLFFAQLIDTYFLNNRHFVRVTLRPDPELEAQEEQEEMARLAQIKAGLARSELLELVEREKKLTHEQEAARHQSLDCLPQLRLSDVPLHIRKFDLVSPAPHTSFHGCFTNQILYADLIFDLPEWASEDLPLISLFAKLLPEIGAGGRNYVDNLAYLQAWIGEFDAKASTYVSFDHPAHVEPVFSLRGKALYRNHERLFSLFIDCVRQLDLSDAERIGDWLQQHVSELDSQLGRRALHYATREVLSGFSLASHLANQWGGIPYYRAMHKWAQPDQLSSLLEKLEHVRRMFSNPPQLILGCDAEYGVHLAQTVLPSWHQQLPTESRSRWQAPAALPLVQSAAYQIASPVAYTALGMKTVAGSHRAAPYLMLAAELMDHLVLHKEIREKGGAYGGGATYAPSTGTFHFYSYRDPALARTLDIFAIALEEVGQGRFTERELEAAKLSALQSSDAPISPGARALTAYGWQRIGATHPKREAFRRALMEATVSDVRDAVAQHLSLQDAVWMTYAGQELLERERPKLKDASLPIFNAL